MPAPMPYAGQKVIVQDLPTVEASPGIVINGEPDGVATVMAFTVDGSSVVTEVPWDNTDDVEPSPDKCWRYNWVTP